MKKTLLALGALGVCTALAACVSAENDHRYYEGRGNYDGPGRHLQHAQIEADRRMQLLDTNNNGTVSRNEWMIGMKQKFSTIDTDRDGLISREEMVDYKIREAGHKGMRHDDMRDNAWNPDRGDRGVDERGPDNNIYNR